MIEYVALAAILVVALALFWTHRAPVRPKGKLVDEIAARSAAFGSAAFLTPGLRWVLSALAALGVWAVLQYVDLTPSVSGDFFFSTEDRRLQEDRRIDEIFPSHAQLLVSVRGPDIRSPDYGARIERLSGELSAIDGVAGVRDIRHGPDSLKEALESPLWRRLLISDDGRSSNLWVELEGEGDHAAVVESIEHVARSHDRADFRVALSGVPYVVEEIQLHLVRDLETFGVAALLIFALTTGLLFRSLNVVWGTVASCVIACAVTLLLYPAVGMETGILTPNISTIVFVLTLSHIVYLTGNWRLATAGGGSGSWLGAALRRTAPASFWSMATTGLSFLTLLLGSAKPLRTFGVSCAAGSLVALMTAYTVYPAFLARARAPERRQGTLAQRLERVLSGKPHRWLVAVAGLLLVVLLPGLSKLDTDPPLFAYFLEGTEVRQGLERVDRSGGSNLLEMVVRDPAGRELNDKRAFQTLWRLQEALEADPDVGTVISLPVLMAEAKRPFFSFLLSHEKRLAILDKPKHDRIGRSFVTPDRKSAYFLLRMRESARDASRLEVVARLETTVRRHGLEPFLTGGLYRLQGQLAELVAASLLTGLAGLLVVFAGISLIVSRALAPAAIMIGTFALVPLGVLGLAGHARMPLDIISAPAVNVALGVGIDDLIHLVYAYRRQKPGRRRWQQWRGALRDTWRPILYSSTILCLGFGILTLSFFPPTRRLGIAIVAGTVLADFVTLFVFPFVVEAVRRRRAPRRGGTGETSHPERRAGE